MLTARVVSELLQQLHLKRDYVTAVNMLIKAPVITMTEVEMVAMIEGSRFWYGRLGCWNGLVDRIYDELLNRGNVDLAHFVLECKNR